MSKIVTRSVISFAGAAVVTALGCGGMVSEDSRIQEDPTDPEWAAWPMPNPASGGLPNPASYTVQGETVKDNISGLVWQRSVSTEEFRWEDAKVYCSSLLLGGIKEWRVPSAIELVSLVDFTALNPTVDASAFPATPSRYFWSSSPFAGVSEPVTAWSVYFWTGSTVRFSLDSAFPVRCVHGAIPLPSQHYSITSGVVTDNGTKLQWQQGLGSSQMTFAEASAYCQSLSLTGTGWRLPSIKELQTIVDRRRTEPPIDPYAFSQTPALVFWSSSPVAGGSPWGVDFGLFGDTINKSTAPDFAVRCVR